MVLSRAHDILSEDDMPSYFGDAGSADEDVSRPGTSTPSNIHGMELTEVGSGTGISWKFANQGTEARPNSKDTRSHVIQVLAF